MNRTSKLGALALGTITTITTLALATPAAAHHNAPETTVDGPGECGQTTITAAWTGDEHQVDNAALVVQAAGEQHTAPVGESLTVGPFEADQTISWRIWGGGERDYDNPPLASLDELVAHLAAGGGELDEDAPGVEWHTLDVTGCPVESTPAPTPEPSVDPTPEPTGDTTTTAPPAGDDEPQLAATGVPALGLAGLGLAALTLGIAAVVATKRRRTTFTS